MESTTPLVREGTSVDKSTHNPPLSKREIAELPMKNYREQRAKEMTEFKSKGYIPRTPVIAEMELDKDGSIFFSSEASC